MATVRANSYYDDKDSDKKHISHKSKTATDATRQREIRSEQQYFSENW